MYSACTFHNCNFFFRRQFLPMCLVYDFSLNDLLAPSKYMLYLILSLCFCFASTAARAVSQFRIWWTKNTKFWFCSYFLEKQKTLTVLSAIMNFLHFRKQRMSVILEKQAKFVCLAGPHRFNRGLVIRLHFYTTSLLFSLLTLHNPIWVYMLWVAEIVSVLLFVVRGPTWTGCRLTPKAI